MQEGFEKLALMDYPGRIIIIGKDKPGENFVTIYAITGRSPSSQARKLVSESVAVWTKPTDDALLENSNISLLIYPAIYIDKGIAVSNGRQTENVREHLGETRTPGEILLSSLKNWDYEPDAPHFTPRISGCILPRGTAAFGIIKRASTGSSLKNIFEFPIIAGKGKMITTYSGENREPLPSFMGEPIDVELEGESAEELAEAVYHVLAPGNQGADFRVSVACVFSRNFVPGETAIHIINRHERIRMQT